MAERVNAEAHRKSAMTIRSTKSLTGRTVLLADDDSDARCLLADALELAGARVLTAGNGLEALRVLADGARPDAMLVDLDMPLMDGQTFCERCDADDALARIPRVLLTANPYAAFFHSRALMVLGKPADVAQVIDHLARVCDAQPLAA